MVAEYIIRRLDFYGRGFFLHSRCLSDVLCIILYIIYLIMTVMNLEILFST